MTKLTAKADICPPANTQQVGKWTLGLLQGVDIPNSFNDPLDDELLDLFEGKDDVKLTDEGS